MLSLFVETLRKYPPVVKLVRQCTKPVKIRGTDISLEKGVQVLLPVLGLHHDPKYYPDPERFDPERFSEVEKKRPQFSFLPFLEGPRICIGQFLSNNLLNCALTLNADHHTVRRLPNKINLQK
jgi:cytochrome P450 family 6